MEENAAAAAEEESEGGDRRGGAEAAARGARRGLQDYLQGVLAKAEDLDLIASVTGKMSEMDATGTFGRAGTRAAGSRAFAM